MLLHVHLLSVFYNNSYPVFFLAQQILALGSQRIPSALRLAHLPSSTVFQNWPTQRIPLGNVSSAAFSPGGGFFAVGNSKGKVLLYRLHHYENA